MSWEVDAFDLTALVLIGAVTYMRSFDPRYTVVERIIYAVTGLVLITLVLFAK